MRSLCALILISLLGLNSLFGQSKYASEVMNLGFGGQSLGMGGAYVAVAHDVTAAYWNPAGLTEIEYPQLMLMHSSRFSGVVNNDYGAAAFPVGSNSSIGFSLFRVGVDNIKVTALTDPNAELGPGNRLYVLDTFNGAHYGFFLTYAKKARSGLQVGGNIKYFNFSFGDNSAWGLGFDFGIKKRLANRLVLGMNLQDVTTTLLAYDTGKKENIRPSLRAGLTYPLQYDRLGGSFHPAIDFVFYFENRETAALFHAGAASVDMNIGWEYVHRSSLALRVGFADVGQPEAQLELGKFSAGLGFQISQLMIDYAFLGHLELGNTHRISARLTLEEPRLRRE